ncbi:MAG TPA: hypothetical protein VJJ82_00375 [Candidatus Nanoarchaeia archaeon]|nr:hypothetical protein [Candidatus Nanoarchaeia archaeon]
MRLKKSQLKNTGITHFPEEFVPRYEKRRSIVLTVKINVRELAKIEGAIPEGSSRSEYVRKKVLGEQDG